MTLQNTIISIYEELILGNISYKTAYNTFLKITPKEIYIHVFTFYCDYARGFRSIRTGASIDTGRFQFREKTLKFLDDYFPWHRKIAFELSVIIGVYYDELETASEKREIYDMYYSIRKYSGIL